MLTTHGRELAGLPRRHHGARPHGRDARAGRAVRRRDHPGRRVGASTCRSARSRVTVGEDRVHRRDADHRHRRVGQVARPAASDKKLSGRGVSTCATCDGFFFKGQPIAVVGGGDTAHGRGHLPVEVRPSVTVIHRRDALRASKIMQDKALLDPEDLVRLEHRGRGHQGRRARARSPSLVLRDTSDRRAERAGGRRRVHRHRPHAEHRRSSRASWPCTTTAT